MKFKLKKYKLKLSKYKELLTISSISLIVLFCLIISTTLSSTNTYTREELQDMVISTALSYYYNNIYIDYDRTCKDADETSGDLSLKRTYAWINYNQSPEEVNRSKLFATSCSAFSTTVYKYSLGYDFSDYFEGNLSYSYLRKDENNTNEESNYKVYPNYSISKTTNENYPYFYYQVFDENGVNKKIFKYFY